MRACDETRNGTGRGTEMAIERVLICSCLESLVESSVQVEIWPEKTDRSDISATSRRTIATARSPLAPA